jgi:peptidoglycan/xylan/chitin deacetylase (PgdA/CDA1 family)
VRQVAQRRRVTIFLWHDPEVETFAHHLAALRSRYNLVSLGEAVAAIGRRDLSGLPSRAAVLTFDDGHAGNARLAPVFRTAPGLTTVFVCATVFSTRRLWFMHAPRSQELRHLPDRDRRRRVESICLDGPDTLSPSELRALAAHCDVQSHTVDHPFLPACDDLTAERELAESKEILARELGRAVTAVAYPNGDYSLRELRLTRAAGYVCGLTVDFGFNGPNTDLWRLRRICLGDDDPLPLVLVKACGLWDLLKIVVRVRSRTGFTAEPWF